MEEFAEQFYTWKGYAWSTRNQHRSSLNTLRHYLDNRIDKCVSENFLESLHEHASTKSNIRVLMKFVSTRCDHCVGASVTPRGYSAGTQPANHKPSVVVPSRRFQPPQSIFSGEIGEQSRAMPNAHPVIVEQPLQLEVLLCEDTVATLCSLADERGVEESWFVGELVRRAVDAEIFDPEGLKSTAHRDCFKISLSFGLASRISEKLGVHVSELSDMASEVLYQIELLIHLPLFQRS